MKDISDRLSDLSPEKQALFKKMMLKKRTAGTSVSQAISKGSDISELDNSSLEVIHSLFDKHTAEGPNQDVYVTNFSAERHWVLNEHRIMGKATLPGTGYLEMARAAFEHHTGIRTMEIRNTYFLWPLTVEENKEKHVRMILKNQGERFSFSVTSQPSCEDGQWQEHARGEIVPLKSELSAIYDIGKIEAACHKQKIIVTEKDLKLRSEIIAFGPRWNNFNWIRLGENQGLASLELPERFASDLRSCHLHPALLDNAVGFLTETVRDEENYLPLYYKSLKFGNAMPRKLYSHVRPVGDRHSQKEALKFDITIMDEEGRELVEIEEYTLRKLGKNDRDDIRKGLLPYGNGACPSPPHM